MAHIYNRNYSRRELLSKVGDISQICEAKFVRLAGGNREGVEAVLFKTGSGLNFSVLPGRGMDLGMADYKGIAFSWRSSTGEVHPAFFEHEGSGMDRSYHGGLVHISGLTYAGLPCTDEGKQLGLHGRASNLAAQNIWVDSEWIGDDYQIWAQGKLRETSALGENVMLTRRVSTKLGANQILIEDRVENLAHTPIEHMLLYHTNFGWPLLDEISELIIPSLKIEPMVPEMEKDLPLHNRSQPPTLGHGGVLFYHDLAADSSGNTQFALINRSLGTDGLGVSFRYSKDMLPNLVQWKMMGKGHYVLECGPSNCRVDGRDVERKRGSLQFLQPFECREYRLEINVLDGAEQIENFIRQTLQLKS